MKLTFFTASSNIDFQNSGFRQNFRQDDDSNNDNGNDDNDDNDDDDAAAADDDDDDDGNDNDNDKYDNDDLLSQVNTFIANLIKQTFLVLSRA